MKILIGPLLPDSKPRKNDLITLKEIAGSVTDEHDFQTFSLQKEEKGDISYIQSFDEILNGLPLGWEPDLVIFWRPEYEYVPDDIELLKCPLIAVIGDWYLGFDYINFNLTRFDAVFTDQKGVGILKRSGFNEAYYFPMWAYDPDLHKYDPEIEKIYDITFVGKLNHFTHHERSKWLYRLAQLSSKYNVKIFNGVFRDDYVKVVNQSKLTFNYAMKQELNMRTYEALACKSLVLIEEKNLEAHLLLKDKKECLYYNEANFEELIDYYLKHDFERQKIVEAGHQKIKSETYENHFRQLLKQAENISPGKRTSNSKLLNLSQRVRKVSSSFFQQEDVNAYLEDTLNLFLRNDLDSTAYDNNLGVLYCELAQNTHDSSYWELAIKSFQEAYEFDIRHPAVLYNMSLAYLKNEKWQQAEMFLKELLPLIKQLKVLIPGYLLFKNDADEFIREWNHCFEFLPESSPDYLKSYQTLLLWKAYEYLGYISEIKGNINEALVYYNVAVIQKGHIATTRYRLALLQHKMGQPDLAGDNFEEVLTEQPFFIPNWFSLIDNLLIRKMNQKSEKYINTFLSVLNSYACSDSLKSSEINVIKQRLLDCRKYAG